MPDWNLAALEAAGIDPEALQRLADACGPLVVIDVGSRETIADLQPIPGQLQLFESEGTAK